MKRYIPSLKLLNYLFSYNKQKGELIWKNHWHPQARVRFVGKEAGALKTTHGKTYKRIHINSKQFYTHILIYFIETGIYNEKLHIDHINGNSLDNRIENLRMGTLRQNHQNRDRHIKGKLVGTHLRKDTGKWAAKIYLNGKEQHLGCYMTEKQAHAAYCKRLKEAGL